MNGGKIRIALADDQRLLREGLRIILEAAPDMLVVGEADDGITATALATTEQPDVMLMDIRMPRRDGIAATEIIHHAHPSVRIILLTTYDTPEQVIKGMRAGASGYILKDCSAEELYAAIRTVARGQILLQTVSAAQLLAGLPSAATPQPSSPPPRSVVEKTGLTERERDVLRLIVQGRSNSEIAAELYVSEATVKTHINHIFSKLGARDRVQAVVLAQQLGLA
ncbi:response regulator [Dictyobacter aurantiacus]|uniref:DNA-binding response regulator n=1 Tax=Dictyobacter aurantiacus TaxID=1936993 RepID=A0A401ZPJ3_9CHLR|nr:response regulator transcription factor [Dictyobacter aurantiacus]GCE08828.1 DNA-binding response regulator [Dictyobacter aurantiacus]